MPVSHLLLVVYNPEVKNHSVSSTEISSWNGEKNAMFQPTFPYAHKRKNQVWY